MRSINSSLCTPAKEQIHEKSPALAELKASGELLIAGAKYNIGTGKVDFL